MADVKIYTATKTDEVIAQAISSKGLNSVVKDVAVTEDGTGIKVVRSNGTETVVNFPAGGSVGSGLTQADIDSAIDALNLEQYALKSDIPAPQDLSEYALKSDIPAPPDLSSVVQTDDPRLVDARTPIDHTHTASDITDFPAIPDISGLATKEEVDSLVYLTGEVAHQAEITPAIFSITIEVRYGDSFMPASTHEFSPTGGEVPEGYDVTGWWLLDKDLSANDFVVNVVIRESGSETYKKITYSPQEGEMTDVTGTLEAYEPPAPSIARLTHEWLYGIFADIISQGAENEVRIIFRSNGYIPAVVKDVYLKSDGSYGPISKVVEGVEVKKLPYANNTTLTTQFSDGESHVQTIPSISINTPSRLNNMDLKSHPFNVVHYPDMSVMEIRIDGSIGSVVYGRHLPSSERKNFLAVESVSMSLDGVAEGVSPVRTVVPLPLKDTPDGDWQFLEVDAETAPVVDLNRISVALLDPSGRYKTQQFVDYEFPEQVVSVEWVDPPQGHLFAVVPGLTRNQYSVVDGVPKLMRRNTYPGIVPLNSNGGGLEQGGSAGPFTPDALGELHLPARSYVEIDVSTATATVKFPAIASSGLMMTACVIGPPENLSFPEGTVNIGQPAPVGGLSFATLLKRASSDWYVIWTQLPATEGV